MTARPMVISVTGKQMKKIKTYEQSRISLADIDSTVLPKKGDSVTFLDNNNHIVNATVTDSYTQRIQNVDPEDIYKEGIRAVVPQILEHVPDEPEGWDEWTEEKKDDYAHNLARATYIAKCQLTKDLFDAFKEYWNSIARKTNIKKWGYSANPLVSVIHFEVV